MVFLATGFIENRAMQVRADFIFEVSLTIKIIGSYDVRVRSSLIYLHVLCVEIF